MSLSWGSVTYRKACRLEAPSISAASYSDWSMPCSAARSESIMNGKLRQILITITDTTAQRLSLKK